MNLGNLFYEVTIKDGTSKGFSDIEAKIKKLNATIAPKISVKDLKQSLKDAMSTKTAQNLSVNISAKIDSASLKSEINKALSASEHIAKIKADTSGLVSFIQNIVSSGKYIAKITADTSAVSSALQAAVAKPLNIAANISVNTNAIANAAATAATAAANSAAKKIDTSASKNTKTTPSAPSADVKKSANDNVNVVDDKSTQRSLLAQQKQLVRLRSYIANVGRLSEKHGGEMSSGLLASRSTLLAKAKELEQANKAGQVLPQEKFISYNNAVRNSITQMRLFREEQTRTAAATKAVNRENQRFGESARTINISQKSANESIISKMNGLVSKYDKQIASIQDKIKVTKIPFGSKFEQSVINNIRELNRQLDEAISKRNALNHTIGQMSRMSTTSTTNLIPIQGSEHGKAYANTLAIQRASKRSDVKTAFLNEEAREKAIRTTDKIATFIQDKKITSRRLDEAFEALTKYRVALFQAKSEENKRTNAPALYREIAEAAKIAENEIARLTKAQREAQSTKSKQASADKATQRSLLAQQRAREKTIQTGYSVLNNADRHISGLSIPPQKLTDARDRLKSTLSAIEGFNKIGYPVPQVTIRSVAELTKNLQRLTNENKNVETSTRKQTQDFKQLASEMQKTGRVTGWLKEQLANVFSLYAARDFLMNIIQIGGEFEKQKLALSSMLGGMERASTLYEQIKSLAVESPFTFGNLTSFTKQLAAYGFQYKDLYDTTKRLADVSAGVGVDMSRIILAYGQVFTAHYLRASELKQFTEAGIPLVDALADRFTKLEGKVVTAGDVFKRISAKDVSFSDVKAVIDELTDAGGRFYNMQEVLASSLSGRWSNFKDRIEIMYSEIASSTGGFFKKTIEGLTELAKEWKLVGGFLIGGFSVLALKKAYLNIVTGNSIGYASRQIAALKAESTAAYNATIAYNNMSTAIRNSNNVKRSQRSAYTIAAARYAIRAGVDGTYSPISKEERGRLKDSWKGKKNPLNFFNSRSIFNSAEALNEYEKKLGTSITKTQRCTIAIKRFGLSFRAMGASIGSAVMSLFTWQNAIFLAIGAVISWWAKNREEQDEFRRRQEESAKASKELYKEFMDFIKNNPIEIAINSNVDADIENLLQKYKEKIENSPVKLDFVLANTSNLSSASEKLKAYKQALKNVADAELELGGGESARISQKAIDATKQHLFNDNIGQNIKDYTDAVNNFKNAVDGIPQGLLDKFFTTIEKRSLKDNSFNDAATAVREYNDGLSDLYTTIQKIQPKIRKEGLFKLGLADAPNASTISDAIDRGEAMKNALDTYKDDVKALWSSLKESFKASNIIGKNEKGEDETDDKGFIMIEQAIQDIGKQSELTEDQMDSLLSFIIKDLKPKAGSSWNAMSVMYAKCMDGMLSNTEAFTGKSSTEIVEGLTNSGNNSMKEMLNAAKKKLQTQFPEWADTIQNIFSNRTFFLDLAFRVTGAGLPKNFYQESFDDFVNREANKLKSDKEKQTLRLNMNKIRPKEGVDIAQNQKDAQDVRSSLKADMDVSKNFYKKRKEEYNRNPTTENKKRLDKAKQEVDKNTTAYNQSDAAFKFMGYYDKDAEKQSKKNENAANKARAAREKAQREYERSMQKEFNQLKRVKDLYEKLRELYGDVEALNKIRNSGLVATKFIPKNVTNQAEFMEKYLKLVKDFRGNLKLNSEEMKNLSDQISMDIEGYKLDIDKSKFDKSVKILETQLERAGDAWKRYKNLVKDGANSEIAGVMAFGDIEEPNKVKDNSVELNYLRDYADRFLHGMKLDIPITNEDLDKILGMNESELKIRFGNDSRITDGLWKIVDTYQKVANEIRSEDEKLVTDLYKSSLNHAEKIDGINKKQRMERARLVELSAKYEPAKKEYNSAKDRYKNIEGLLNQERDELLNSKEQIRVNNADISFAKAKNDLDNAKSRKGVSRQELNTLKANFNKANKERNEAMKALENTKLYKHIEKLEKEREDAAKQVSNAQTNLQGTLPPNELPRLLAQIDRNSNKEKGGILDEMMKNTNDGYNKLFNNVYNIASKTARDIADGLISILDKRLADGTITQEDYNKSRTEIEQQVQKTFETPKEKSLFFSGFSGITKSKLNEANGNQEYYSKRLSFIDKMLENVDSNSYLTDQQKEEKKEDIKKATNYKDIKKEYEKSIADGNKAKQKEAKQELIGASIDKFTNGIDSIARFRDTLGETMSSFGIDTENNEGWQKFSTAVDVMSDIGSGVQNAFQSIMSGDFFGAAMSIVTTPLSIITSFNKLHDKKLDRQIELSKKRSEEIKAAAEQITNSIKDSLGKDAAKRDALNSYNLLSKQMGYIAGARNGNKNLGSSYQTLYKLLSGEYKITDFIESGSNDYKDKEERAALKSAGFDKGLSDTYFELVDKQKDLSKQLSDSMTQDALNGEISKKTKYLSKAYQDVSKMVADERRNAKNTEISVYGAQYIALLEQRKELEQQMYDENDKKNSDPEKMKEYRTQLAELNNQIRDFAKNLAKELYGIDLSSWASQLGDALTTAFQNGTDAAQAFRTSVNEIMRSIVKNMVIQDMIKPMFKNMETELFGEEGKGGGVLSDINNPDKAIKDGLGVVNKYLGTGGIIEEKIPTIQAFWEALNEKLGGSLNDISSSSSSSGATIKGLTEETGSLLASYVNAIRADVSISRNYLKEVAETNLPQLTVLVENQLRHLSSISEQTKMIQDNTKRNAESAEAIRSYLNSIITFGNGGKAIRIK